jgi:hypothetical protein
MFAYQEEYGACCKCMEFVIVHPTFYACELFEVKIKYVSVTAVYKIRLYLPSEC